MAAAWKEFKTAMKEKKNSKKTSNTKKFDWIKDEIVVQQLSSEVCGKAQKYSRMGPRVFVPFHYVEVTFDNIKAACERFFKSKLKDNTCCDILAGEQGPSCQSLEQIPNLKVIHLRIIEKAEVDSQTQSPQLEVYSKEKSTRLPIKRRRTHPISLQPQQPARSTSVKSSCTFPKSLSVVDMLKLGKVIKEKPSTIIELSSFDINQMEWSPEFRCVEFVINPVVIGVGGFREAFSATSRRDDFNTSTWVVKKYLANALENIKATNQTAEQHTRKVVKMHLLARNFAKQLQQEVCKRNNEEVYGEFMSYNNIYLGKMDDGEFVTVEEFVKGSFDKYINKDGTLCGTSTYIRMKAESLSHYSYVRSDEKLMVVDIQGSSHKLFNPEIASYELQEDDEYLFSTGNIQCNNHICERA
ncbi:transient receptor potential cation channel subfamily M member 6-like [Paramuricea clavata]|uniref:Transient receptor potential cation channel subfamily M member 6-like n=1 Tax=Paramuricea clavata TaxID=317549 RepID=A0A6S7HQ80_PARCT|nr:transient receptor potential cation channel subfamily M member 6-like [Paramuricea clavata]